MDKEEGKLFEIKDTDYALFQISGIVIALLFIIVMLLMGATLEEKGLYSLRTLVSITIGGTIWVLFALLFVYKKRKIVFFGNKILLKNGDTILKDILVSDISEVYKILPHHGCRNNATLLTRGSWKRTIALVVLFPAWVIFTLGFYLTDFIFYRDLLLKRYRLLIIGKTDKDFVVVNYTGKNENDIKKYFEDTLKSDFQLKQMGWFFCTRKKYIERIENGR